jgi:hypothetical protein
MAISHTTALPTERGGVRRLGARIRALAVVLGIAALFAALTAAYFAVNAGDDYPEPAMRTSQ